jgi:hypothetical protein
MRAVRVPNHSLSFHSKEDMPPAGFADYLVSFAQDVTVKEVLLLDATPDVKLGGLLRSTLMDYRVGPSASSDASKPRLAFIPVTFDDGQYRLAPRRPSSPAS